MTHQLRFAIAESTTKQTVELNFYNMPEPITASDMFDAFHSFFLAAGFQEGSFQDCMSELVTKDIAKNMPQPSMGVASNS